MFVCMWSGCQADCDGLECGDDGCGGNCGICADDGQCVEGTCQEPAAVLMLNEINANVSSSCDLVELHVVAAGSLQDLELWERNSAILTFGDADVAAGDIIVVHLDSSDAVNCNGAQAGSEFTAKNEQAAAEYGITYDGAWDWFSNDSGLVSTDNVLTVLDAQGVIQDALLVSDGPDGTTAKDSETQAAAVAAAGEWTAEDGTVPEGGFVDDSFNAHAAQGLKSTGTKPEGQSISRTSVTDTDTKADWSLVDSTWGELNAGQ